MGICDCNDHPGRFGRRSPLEISFLKLDSGFDDDKIVFENLNNQSLYKIAIVILGGFLMVDSFPRIINWKVICAAKCR